jgi:outer membrane protein W
MRSPNVLRLASLAIAVAAAPGGLAAQVAGGVIVTPYAGVYVPTNDIVSVAVSRSGAAAANVKHETAFLSGVNVSYWLTDRLGLEGGAAYTKSGVKGNLLVENTGGSTFEKATEYAHIWLGSAKMMVQLLPRTSEFNLRLGLGPAIVSRAGKAYTSDSEGKVTGKTDIGGVLSLCSRMPLSKMVSVRLRAEDYMYSGKIGYKSSVSPTESLNFDSRFQHDLVFSAGLQLFLNK